MNFKKIIASLLVSAAVCMDTGSAALPMTECTASAAASSVYSSAEEWLASGYDKKKITIYDGVMDSADDYVPLKGRKYYQGIKMSPGGSYYETSEISFNVEDVSTISFDVGRIDGAYANNATISVYKNGSWWQDIELDCWEFVRHITLDVSDADTLRFYIPARTNTNYLLGDISVDSLKTVKTYDVPAYSNGADIIFAAYNRTRIATYNGVQDSDTDYIQINGKKYYQGVNMYPGEYSYEPSRYSVNTENVKTYTFTVGRIDNTNKNDAVIEIYKDGKWFYNLAVDAESTVKYYSIDVEETSILMFEINARTNSSYGMVNIALDENYSAEDLSANAYTGKTIVSIEGLKYRGDVDLDYSVSLSDASMVLTEYAHVAASLPESFDNIQAAAGDVNWDGIIDISDAAAILTFYAGNAAGLNLSWDDALES